MDTFIYVVISVISAGIFVPIIMKWIMKIQKKWKRKLFVDNGRIDLIDEICEYRNSNKQ